MSDKIIIWLLLVNALLWISDCLGVKKHLLSFYRKKRIQKYISKDFSKPQKFGEGLIWLAIREGNVKKIIEKINTNNEDIYETNWSFGVKGAEAGYCFISPRINDYILVISSNKQKTLIPLGKISRDEGGLNHTEIVKSLRKLSHDFTEIQYFDSINQIWGKFSNGKTLRYMSADFFGSDTNKIKGTLSEIELEFVERVKSEMIINGEDVSEYMNDGINELLVDSEIDVFEVAESWSLNPKKLSNTNSYNTNLGYIFKL